MKIAVLFAGSDVKGKINVVNGSLKNLSAANVGRVSGNEFQLSKGGRLEIALGEFSVNRGGSPTIVNVVTEKTSFSFFLRDVSSEYPVYIPEYGVAVTNASDKRDYAAVVKEITSRKLQSEFDRYEAEPEESYENAAAANVAQCCTTWLGLGRDMRIFRVQYHEGYGFWGLVTPAYHTFGLKATEMGDGDLKVDFYMGPGAACRRNIKRWLEDGCLPILRSTQNEGDVDYNVTAFATLERSELKRENVRGSQWMASFANTGGNMLASRSNQEIDKMEEGERQKIRDLIEKETKGCDEEVVCVVRIQAVNNGKVPSYAWIKSPGSYMRGPTNDFTKWGDGTVYCVNRLDGKPMPSEEMSILLNPGQSVDVDFIIPHHAISVERAGTLMKLDFEKSLDDCRKYWREQLETSAKFEIPEKVINESLKAGILHCDIATLGLQDEGPALATVGLYSPIGSESAPIIQYFDCVGWHRLAERSIDFFLERQRPDGFMQNFGGYQLETGPVLWTMGEHFRYTRDIEWARRVKSKMLKSCEYLLQWRERNKTEECRSKGCYGLMDGKVADPEDFFHSFMLNAVSYIGLSRAAEILSAIDPSEAEKLSKEVVLFKEDIRNAYSQSLAKAPAVPIGDGSWAPMPPPWTEYNGGLCFYADGGRWWTHGTFSGRDALVGPMWLVICEVLTPEEIGAQLMLKTNQLITKENAGLSQPYYCRHDFAHLKRSEVKEYLKTYYNQLSALQDRETYTFSEHYFQCSQHKTHEEAWFLMQTRWMLYLEEGNTLTMFKAIPRRWLEDGKKIALDGVKSYFGAIVFKAESDLKNNLIKAEIKMEAGRLPAKVAIRLPHPEGLKAVACEGGSYDPATETVNIANFNGRASLILKY
ncbi:MAG: hypothetical protein NT118_14215 [Lentisphaerae bacterium]|nr:hypothetical protein [Lentisphaerota bacterium]